MGRFMKGRFMRMRREGPTRDQGSSALRVWTYLSVLLSVFAITAHEDFGALRYSIAALVTAGFLLSWSRRSRRNTWIKVLLTVGCLAAGWVFLRSLAQDPYHTSIPLTVLLLWLQTLHSFDLPRRRDLLFSLLSSVVLMAVAAAFSLDLTYGAYLAPYAVVATIALIYNAGEAGSALAASIGSGSAARSTGAVAREGLGRLSARGVLPVALGLVGVLGLVAILVFLLTPRLPGLFISPLFFTPRVPLLEALQGAIVNPAYPPNASGTQVYNPNGYFGFGPTIDLRLRGRLNDQVVVRVRSLERRNWRALVFDTYTGSGWQIADHVARKHTSSLPPIPLVQGRDDVYAYRGRTRRLVQTFYIQRDQPNVAFAVPRAENIYLAGDHVYVDRYSSVRLPFVLERGMVYTVVSLPLDPDPATLEQAGEAYPWFIKERYLQLPRDLPERVHALAREITLGVRTPYDRVRAINRYLWTQYRYDLTIGPQRRPGDAVDYFLFEERRGYCEQFSSAMVVLLRAVGIPSRLATGYTPGTANPLTGLLEVRNSDAHAWVEVFFPGTGWVEFEPTPSFPDPAALGGPGMPRWGWQGFVEFFGARLGAVALPGWVAAVASGLGKSLVWLLGGSVSLAALLLIRAARSPSRPPLPGDEILGAYAFLIRLLSRRRLLRRPGETPREFAGRAQATCPWPEIPALTALVEEAVFGPTLPTAAMAAAASHHRASLATRP
jgi:transglutaminase-like putative cysteine protease